MKLKNEDRFSTVTLVLILFSVVAVVIIAASFPASKNKDWVDVLRALLTPLAGFIALLFAALKYKLSSRRREDDIFYRQFDLLMDFVNFGDQIRINIKEESEQIGNNTSLNSEQKSRRLEQIHISEVRYRAYALAISARQILGERVFLAIQTRLEDPAEVENMGNYLRSGNFLDLVQRHMVKLT
ncbi:MAG: hypothetical protein AAF192_17065 [Pseudomonadota bacterium]